MMTVTHIVIGMALGYISGALQPDLTVPLVLTGLIGGLIPDLDLILDHRKSLHFPAYYTILGAISLTAAAFFSSSDALLATVFFGAATLHCLTDIFVGSIGSTVSGERKECKVYLHPERRWLSSKELIRFSGAAEDLALSLLIGIPLILVLPNTLKFLTGAILLIGALYTHFQLKEYNRYAEKQDTPSIKEMFEKASESRNKE